MTTPITLDLIEQEAIALECDAWLVDDTFLEITKRADPDFFYRSLQPYDDPRVLASAYAWLQTYRAYLDQVDQARRDLAQHRRTRGRNTSAHSRGALLFALARVIVVSAAACVLYLWLAQGYPLSEAFVRLIAVPLILLACGFFCVRRVTAYRRSQWKQQAARRRQTRDRQGGSHVR